jgi:antitoxin (DNA-binding transcriptional repressor) of toxin-antitoxin stability system
MFTLTLSQAKATFSKVIRRVESGDEVLITKRGKPVVRLSQFTPPAKQPIWGAMKGHDFKIAPDFDNWSEELDGWTEPGQNHEKYLGAFFSNLV